MPYSAADVRAREILARILLVAGPKAGKTVCAVGTSPGRVFCMNTDGKGGLDGTILLGYENWEAEDIATYGDYGRALLFLKQNISRFRTCVFDNLSTMALIIEDEVRKELRDDPRVIYPEITRRLVRIVRDLIALPIHIVLVSQVKPTEGATAASFDHLLALSGGATVSVPMLVQDFIWLEVGVDQQTGKVTRQFFLSPQGTWKKAVRSLRDLACMEANVTEYLNLCRTLGVGAPVAGQLEASVEELSEANTTPSFVDTQIRQAEIDEVVAAAIAEPSAEEQVVAWSPGHEPAAEDTSNTIPIPSSAMESVPPPQTTPDVPGLYTPKKSRSAAHAKQ